MAQLSMAQHVSQVPTQTCTVRLSVTRLSVATGHTHAHAGSRQHRLHRRLHHRLRQLPGHRHEARRQELARRPPHHQRHAIATGTSVCRPPSPSSLHSWQAHPSCACPSAGRAQVYCHRCSLLHRLHHNSIDCFARPVVRPWRDCAHTSCVARFTKTTPNCHA